MKLKFNLKSPNFAITDKGKFALCELDAEDFIEYLDAYREVIVKRRLEQDELRKLDAILGVEE